MEYYVSAQDIFSEREGGNLNRAARLDNIYTFSTICYFLLNAAQMYFYVVSVQKKKERFFFGPLNLLFWSCNHVCPPGNRVQGT